MMDYKDEDVLRELYHDEDMTLAEVGEELGESADTVRYWMEKRGIERRGPNRKPKVPQNVAVLQDNGPTPRTELPNPSVTVPDRRRGATVFKHEVRSRDVASDVSTPQNATAIAYLVDEHDRVEVAREWLAHNEGYVDAMGEREFLVGVSSSAGKKWLPAFREAYGELEGDS